MIFNYIFDKIYVINLKKSEDRRQHIINEFNRVGIEKYEFFEATPHDSEEAINLMNSSLVKKFPNCFRCNQKRCDCENNFLTPFQIGNWCSFLNIFKDIIKNNYRFILICEDDIVFSQQHERIINKLLSPQSFKAYNIQMNKPLLIRLGTAYNPDNHNSTAPARFLKNYSLCNPCFAINREMAIVYLHYLKIIDYHSDVYFHQKIPKNIPGIQYFTMYPYPVYELSFVKEKQKFMSTVRPHKEFRRIEYKDFLLLSSNVLLTPLLKNFSKLININLSDTNINYFGNINTFVLIDEKEKGRYFFENKFLITDDYETDIQIIYKNLILKNNYVYEPYLKKINQKFSIDINLEIKDNDTLDDTMKKIKLFYDNYIKLLSVQNVIIININDNNSNKNYLLKFINKNMLNQLINQYNYFKTKFLSVITDENANEKEVEEYSVENEIVNDSSENEIKNEEIKINFTEIKNKEIIDYSMENLDSFETLDITIGANETIYDEDQTSSDEKEIETIFMD